MLKRLTNLNIFLILLLAFSVCISGIAEAQNPQDPQDQNPQEPQNRVPETINTFPGVNLTVGGTSATFSLGSYFSDPENQPLTYTATSSDTSIATVSISPTNVLTVTAQAAGTATITVIAIDPGNLSTEQQFSATVTTPNNPPTTVGTIPDQTLTEDGAAVTVDVSSYFNDADGDTLTYAAELLNNTTIATVSMSSATVTITPVLTGEATIVVIATDTSGANATQKFSITVNSANAAPTAVGTIPNQTVKLGATDLTIEVDKYFQDTDGDVLTFTATSADSTKATVSVSISVVTITAVAEGSTTITVTATDPGNLFAKQAFSLTVKPRNRAPVAVGSMSDSTVMIGGSGDEKNVRLYFTDADADPLTYSAISSDTTKATVRIEDVAEDVTMLYVTPVAAGTATITVTATDTEGATATQSYTLTVIPQNNAPTPKQGITKLPDQFIKVGGTTTLNLADYFTDPDGDTLTYTVTSADTTKATVSVSSATLTITAVAEGTTTITARATDPGEAWTKLDGSVTVRASNSAPTAISISDQTMNANQVATIPLSSYFSDPDNDALTYAASSSDTAKATTSLSGTTLTVNTLAAGTVTISATATDPFGSSASLSFTLTINAAPGTADTIPGLSTTEQLLLGQLLTYSTIIFNELHNGSDDVKDWLELRNVSAIDIPIDEWQLRILTSEGNVIIPFPKGTVIPAGQVLLITNTEMATANTSVAPVVIESFALPQSEFALIIRSPNVFGDIAGNYYEGQKERPATAPALTVDTVWDRTQPIVSGYRTEAWAKSTHRNGLGSPGYQLSAVAGDLNNDGVVNILDLVLVASQFGITGHTAADLNGDNTVNIQDLVLVANAISNIGAAPTVKQSDAAIVYNWLQLARQNESKIVKTDMPKGFSYERGIEVLEQLARALTPDATVLLANYPNPFNPETWIPYQLAKAADVTVTIYASDGNVVRTLALGHQDAGMYKTRTQAAYWDGKNEMGESVASGIYFYTLTAGSFSATRKMLILK